MVAARPNQKRPAYGFELSTRLSWRVEIHSRIARNFAPSQYPTKPETATPENAYAHFHPVLTIDARANIATRTARIPWNTRELRKSARPIPSPRP